MSVNILCNSLTSVFVHGCPHPQVASAGVGRPRVIVGTNGQYYILSSPLCCKVCQRIWFADIPQWLEKLLKHKWFTNLLPAFLTYKKAICKTVMEGKSPNNMENQVNELMQLKCERACIPACHTKCQGSWSWCAWSEKHWAVHAENTPWPFGSYEDKGGWNGISVSSSYLTGRV